MLQLVFLWQAKYNTFFLVQGWKMNTTKWTKKKVILYIGSDINQKGPAKYYCHTKCCYHQVGDNKTKVEQGQAYFNVININTYEKQSRKLPRFYCCFMQYNGKRLHYSELVSERRKIPEKLWAVTIFALETHLIIAFCWFSICSISVIILWSTLWASVLHDLHDSPGHMSSGVSLKIL